MRLYEALAEYLRARDVEVVFGLMGDGNLFFVEDYVRTKGGRYISVAHESTAVLAALGYAKATGRVGVATVTHGPALTNTVSALIQGSRGRTPAVVIAGDTAVVDERSPQNVAQKAVADVAETLFVQVRSLQTWEDDLDRAFLLAERESRPVLVNVPIDFMWGEAAFRPAAQRVLRSVLHPHPAAVEAAANALATAERPLVLAGSGATTPGAREAAIELARQLGAPLMTTVGAKDLFRGERSDLGIFGGLASEAGRSAIDAADSIVVLGASLNVFTTQHDQFIRGRRLVICENDPQRARADVPGAVQVIGDAEVFASELRDALRALRRVPDERWAGAGPREQGLDEFPSDETWSIASIYRVIDELLPMPRTIVTDVGRFAPHAWRHLTVDHPRRLVTTMDYGSIGMGTGYAIGAATAAEAAPVALLAGDGGYMLGGFTELTTAIRHRLDLTVIVLNDGSYGAEYVQFEARGLAVDLSTFEWPDLAAVARAAGAAGFTATTLDELRRALTAPVASGPRLVDVRLDPSSIPNMMPKRPTDV